MQGHQLDLPGAIETLDIDPALDKVRDILKQIA
jgi:hypothetical protein